MWVLALKGWLVILAKIGSVFIGSILIGLSELVCFYIERINFQWLL